MLALSVDQLDKHHGWIQDINETQGVEVNFPIIADEDRTVSGLYDMIHPNASETATVRSLFIISSDKKSETDNFLPGIVQVEILWKYYEL